MAVQAILDSLEAYTGELDSLNAFTQTATRELGPDWTDKIYGALGELSDYQKEKLDHAFNYYAATTAWNEIQSYLTHDGPLNYNETVERLPILEHWLAFFGAAGEEVVSSLKSRLKLEGAAAAQDTSVLDEPFATAPAMAGQAQNSTSGDENMSVAEQTAVQGEAVQPQAKNISDNQAVSETQSISEAEFETVPREVVQNDVSRSGQNGVFLNEELNTERMQERINDIFSDESSFEKTHKIVGQGVDSASEMQTVKPEPISDERPDELSKNAVDSGVSPEQVQEALKETAQRETGTIFEESDLNDFFRAADGVSQQGAHTLQPLPQQDKRKGYIIEAGGHEAAPRVSQHDEKPTAAKNIRSSERNVAISDDSLDEFFAATATANEIADTDGGQKETDVVAADKAAVAAVVGTAIGAAASSVVSDDIPRQPERPQKQPILQDVEQVTDAHPETVREVQSQMTQEYVTAEQAIQPQQMQGGQNQTDRERPMQVTAMFVDEREIHAPYTPQNASETYGGQTGATARLTIESEEEFKVNRVFRQIDFKSAVQAWVSARCIELGYTNNYKYRYYGFLVDVMDRTIEEINAILADETLHDFVERKKQGGIHFLQNQLIALEKESKDAHDRITADLSPLPREGLSADDVRKALGQMDLSGEKEYLGPAPDGFEMLEDPYQNLDEAAVKKEYAKIEAEADLPPAEPVKPVEPSDLKKPMVSIKSASQTPQNGVQRKMSFSFGKKTTPAGSNNS